MLKVQLAENNKFIIKVLVSNLELEKELIINALFDTGANGSVILTRLVKELNLTKSEIKTLVSLGNNTKHESYKMNCMLQNHNIALTLDVLAVDTISSDNTIDMVIGMEVIKLGTTYIKNDILEFKLNI